MICIRKHHNASSDGLVEIVIRHPRGIVLSVVLHEDRFFHSP